MTINISQTTPRHAAKRLNDHCDAKLAGFYGIVNQIASKGRFFGARVRNGTLQVTPDHGDSWVDVNLSTCSFEDHNGRRLYL